VEGFPAATSLCAIYFVEIVLSFVTVFIGRSDRRARSSVIVIGRIIAVK
jgi:hypothetical protein